ncbi:hypothetical protein [Pseudotabrizicola algicola]|uniref:Uncharacterized protein n=1 Tax=Pseudotabrizicola algicola TaxID=2709381 RepID=A0A6B3RTP3_9RHOB|nr:hypothetical protein [Pseudotabrizicola algicola]NEX48783.1 hypothetical protein [Pseudotabrizicola algicola]
MTLWRKDAGRSPPANPDTLRQRIDLGSGADKIDYPDPAAAPLGTDDEASGHPVTQEQLDMALATETRSKGGPSPLQSGRQENPVSNFRFVVLLVIAGAALIALTILLTS